MSGNGEEELDDGLFAGIPNGSIGIFQGGDEVASECPERQFVVPVEGHFRGPANALIPDSCEAVAKAELFDGAFDLHRGTAPCYRQAVSRKLRDLLCDIPETINQEWKDCRKRCLEQRWILYIQAP